MWIRPVPQQNRLRDRPDLHAIGAILGTRRAHGPPSSEQPIVRTPRGVAMDDDPVLRALGAALERDDPRLATLLRAGPSLAGRRDLVAPPGPAGPPAPHRPPRRRPPGWVLWLGATLAGTLLVLASIPLGLAAFGMLGLGLLLLAPVAACWWCATADELRPPEWPAR